MSIPQLMIVLLWILRVVVAELLKEGVKALLKLWSKRSKRKD